MFDVLAQTAVEGQLDEINQKVGKLTELTDGLMDRLIAFGIDLLIAVLIFAAGKLILKMIKKLIRNIFTKSGVDLGVAKFIDSIVNVLGYIIIFIIICGQIGIQTTSFITLLGTPRVSIGLALQGSLSNFAGGILILVGKPFVVGDYIIAENVEGTVEKIDIIYTTLTTVDNRTVKFPNGTLSNSIVINSTNQGKRRVDVPVGIGYQEDVAKAKKIAESVMKSCPMMLPDEENAVVVRELGESSVNLEIRMWSATKDYFDAKFYLNEKVKEAFDQNQIDIPYRQVDVHLVQRENKSVHS